MSIESMAIALHHSQATGTAKLVLLGIANHDGDGGAFPSVRTLSKYAVVTPRNVQKHVDTLIGLGEVVRHVQQGGFLTMADHDRPNLYEFKLECPANCDRTKNHNLCAECGDPRFKSKKYTCPACKSVDNAAAYPLSEATPPVNSDARPLSVATSTPLSVATPKPSLEPPLNSDVSLLSTSPGDSKACWSCGQVHPLNKPGFCRPCVMNNLDTPMISCTGCGVARKRIMRGEQQFICGVCKDDQAKK